VRHYTSILCLCVRGELRADALSPIGAEVRGGAASRVGRGSGAVLGRLAEEVSGVRVGADLKKLRQSKPLKLISRFAFGGAVTVIATLIANRYGPVIGGLFLEFPGIFPPSVSLTEKHAEVRKQRRTGKSGKLFGRAEASVEAAGASAGAIGLAIFALVLWKGLPAHGLLMLLPLATAAWAFVGIILWRIRENI